MPDFRVPLPEGFCPEKNVQPVCRRPGGNEYPSPLHVNARRPDNGKLSYIPPIRNFPVVPTFQRFLFHVRVVTGLFTDGIHQIRCKTEQKKSQHPSNDGAYGFVFTRQPDLNIHTLLYNPPCFYLGPFLFVSPDRE
jgi:hypothetical protein